MTVAVLDTGVAYPAGDPSRPGSPDLDPDQFVPGYDFVDGDEIPYDQNGHGTHVASTIAEQTDNAKGVGRGREVVAPGAHRAGVRRAAHAGASARP